MRTKWNQIVEKVANDGWSDWRDLETEHRISCCECGLVHDIEFETIGGLKARARVNKRATAQMRRKKTEQVVP